MKKQIVLLGFILISAVSVTITGCYRDVIVPPITQAGPPPAVSFNLQIKPILAASCAKSGCHVPGGQVPYMDSTEAFKDLTSGGFVNTIAPSQSIIIQELNGNMQANIPSGADITLILDWIENGAENN